MMEAAEDSYMNNLEKFCFEMEKITTGIEGDDRQIAEAKDLMKEILNDTSWFSGFLLSKSIQTGSEESIGIWPNEFTIFKSPEKNFSVLAYIWEPDAEDKPHDHGAWGIISPVTGIINEVKFRRLDKGEKEGYAELGKISERVIHPGVSTIVLPHNEGIHAMNNPGSIAAASINVYGKGSGRGYINFYSPEKKMITKIYPPAIKKRILAAETAAILSPEKTADSLKRAIKENIPVQIKKGYEDIIKKLSKNQRTYDPG